jgi:hypothetical protein
MLQFRMSIDTMRGRVQLSAREVNEQTAAKIAGHFIRIGAVLDEDRVERNGYHRHEDRELNYPN